MTWKPLLIEAPDRAADLERVSLESPPLNEGQLQELLRLHPKLLPLHELEPGCSQVTCIGREVRTGSGPLDHLLISPNGLLTLVETKLWKNPEARREVVGQIIDYTKQIARWDYSQLEQAAKLHLAKFHQWTGSLYDWLEGEFGSLPAEAEFIDTVSRNLQLGRFLLLVVGDGIRERVEAMVEYLQGTPSLHFKLALVEIRFYRTGPGDWPLLAIPRVIAKTAEIERAVIRVELSEQAKALLQVTTSAPTQNPVAAGQERNKPALSEEMFLEALAVVVGQDNVDKLRTFLARLDDLDDLERSTNQRLILKWVPESADGELWINLLQFGPKGFIWTETNRSMEKRVFTKLNKGVLQQFWSQLGRIHPNLEPTFDAAGNRSKVYVPVIEIIDRLGDLEVAIRDFVAAAEQQLACG